MEPNRGPNLYGPDPLDPTGQATGMPNPYAQPYGSTQPQNQQCGGAPTAQPAGNPYAQPYGSAQPTGGPYAAPASQPSPAATDQSGQDQTGFAAPEGGNGGTDNGTV